MKAVRHSDSLLQAIRLPFWFACFWAVVGVVWRPPLSSVGLIAIFLVLLVGVEWLSRRLTAKKLLSLKPPKIKPTDEMVLQQMTRSKTAEGLDRLDGTFCVEFPAEAMTATVHIPFCPAFENVPKVQVFPVDATEVNLRITSIKMFGMRVDVKRSDAETNSLRFAVIAEG
jgi:hypothetical protein